MAVSATTSNSVSAVADQMAAGLAGGGRGHNGNAKKLSAALKELSILEQVPSGQRTGKQTSRIAKLKKQIGKLFRAVFGGSTWSQYIPKSFRNSVLVDQLMQRMSKLF